MDEAEFVARAQAIPALFHAKLEPDDHRVIDLQIRVG